MRAVDTNVLVYAAIDASPFHSIARNMVIDLAEGNRPWAIPWPCVYEFLRVATHPAVFDPPMPREQALSDIEALMSSPTVMMLSETRRHFAVLEELLAGDAGVTGNLLHDAHIAALCIEHGATTLVTGDSDFLRFSRLSVDNPFS